MLSWFLILVAVFVLVAPPVFIWAVNALFGLGIPLRLWIWMAAIAIVIIVAGLAAMSSYPPGDAGKHRAHN